MKKGELVLVHLSDDQRMALKGNNLSPMPGIVVSVWENEYPQHPIDKTGVNVRVFTDSNDNPIWLTSLPANFDGAKEMFGTQCAFFERTNSANELIYPKEVKQIEGFPRRNRLDLNTPAEMAIYNAIQEVEKVGAHPLLTQVVTLLDSAKGILADYIESEK